jgi:hypothetical protein
MPATLASANFASFSGTTDWTVLHGLAWFPVTEYTSPNARQPSRSRSMREICLYGITKHRTDLKRTRFSSVDQSDEIKKRNCSADDETPCQQHHWTARYARKRALIGQRHMYAVRRLRNDCAEWHVEAGAMHTSQISPRRRIANGAPFHVSSAYH